MRCIEIKEPGGPDVLTLATRASPLAVHGEVLIAVEAAGVARPDVLQRRGFYPPPPGASDLPGLEVAGTIAELGEGVHQFQRGDRVCALVAGGGYAELCVAPAVQVLPIPAGFSMIEAAAIPENTFTVWTNVFDRGALERGETFLVHGGSSGIGTTAIKLARAFGARVFATAGSAEKCAACEGLGAEKAFNYKSEDWVAGLKEKTAGRGADVVLDMVAGDYAEKNLDVLAADGRIVFIAFQRGPIANINVMQVMQKRATITGSTLRARSPEEKGRIAAALREKVWPLFERGEAKPEIDSVFALEDAKSAHERMESGAHVGKIVLRVQREVS